MSPTLGRPNGGVGRGRDICALVIERCIFTSFRLLKFTTTSAFPLVGNPTCHTQPCQASRFLLAAATFTSPHRNYWTRRPEFWQVFRLGSRYPRRRPAKQRSVSGSCEHESRMLIFNFIPKKNCPCSFTIKFCQLTIFWWLNQVCKITNKRGAHYGNCGSSFVFVGIRPRVKEIPSHLSGNTW